MGKVTNSSLITLCVVVNHFKRLNVPTTTVCEVKLNYIHIYVHSHYKKIFNKEQHIVPFWKSMLNVYLI
jgi:hypothetical protein